MAGHFLDFGPLLGVQRRGWAGQNVENDQLFFGHVLPDVALLLVVQVAAEAQQLLI